MTKTNLYQDGEGLFVDTLQEMISDPFNKINYSEHASNLLSCAQRVLQKRSLGGKAKFKSIVDKLWKAATAGEARVLPSSQREKMWKSFHTLVSNSEFILEFEVYRATTNFKAFHTISYQEIL